MNIKKKVLIVDDSSFMRKILTDVISKENWIEVIDIAKNGVEALEKVKIHKPDIVTLDVQMPLMDGITCLKSIMREAPTPVLIVSGLTKEGADITINALQEGAVDFITKPESIFSLKEDIFSNELIQKLKVVSSTKNNINLNNTKLNLHQSQVKDKIIIKENIINNIGSTLKYLVAIGTSTGGPRALQEVLTALPANLPAAIPIVQHMPPGFTKSLAARLDSLCNINVKEAEDGDILQMGWAYIAPGDSHIRIVKKNPSQPELRIMLTKEPPVGGHRPSANILFSSIAEIGIKNTAGVIMTGMGSDGCEGLKQMHSINNAQIIAQNEASCVVYGMPKSVVQAGIANKVVHLNDIAKEIVKIVGV